MIHRAFKTPQFIIKRTRSALKPRFEHKTRRTATRKQGLAVVSSLELEESSTARTSKRRIKIPLYGYVYFLILFATSL